MKVEDLVNGMKVVVTKVDSDDIKEGIAVGDVAEVVMNVESEFPNLKFGFLDYHYAIEVDCIEPVEVNVRDIGIKVKLTDLAKKLKIEIKRATDGSNGYDLMACIDKPISITSMEIVKIPTGLHIWLGDGLFNSSGGSMALSGLYLPRSSNNNLILTNTVGLLDSDYQGESFLKYKNIGNEPITINPLDRIGQLLIVPSFIVDLNVVDSFDDVTKRGEGGDGSTGV